MPGVLSNIVGVGQHVKRILVPVRWSLMDPEQDATDERQHGNDTVVPYKQRVLGQGHEGLANRVGEGRHEVPVRRDERTHVLRSLRESELKTSNGGENLRETNKDVGHGLSPDIDRCGVVARVHLVTAGTSLVDVVLDYCGGDHGKRGKQETERNALDWCEANASLAQRGVQELVDDGDEDDERDGVEVGDNVVGHTITGHGRSLGGQVVVHLVVGQPVQRNPGEARASTETTSDLIDPGVVKLHPLRLVGAEVARLDIFPETLAFEVLTSGDRVD